MPGIGQDVSQHLDRARQRKESSAGRVRRPVPALGEPCIEQQVRTLSCAAPRGGVERAQERAQLLQQRRKRALGTGLLAHEQHTVIVDLGERLERVLLQPGLRRPKWSDRLGCMGLEILGHDIPPGSRQLSAAASSARTGLFCYFYSKGTECSSAAIHPELTITAPAGPTCVSQTIATAATGCASTSPCVSSCMRRGPRRSANGQACRTIASASSTGATPRSCVTSYDRGASPRSRLPTSCAPLACSRRPLCLQACAACSERSLSPRHTPP